MSPRERADLLAAQLAVPGPGFHATWSATYAAQSVGAWLVWRADASRGAYDVPGFAFYGAQLGLGVAWALLFFGLRRPALALVTASMLWVAIALTITEFARRHRFAALLLFPYLGWATYATVVNAAAVYARSRTER
jgi:tryptophan-rich sensory protein